MAIVNLFIAFFVIVALAISWLVFNLVFGTKPRMARTGDEEIHPTAPETSPNEPVVEAPAPPAVTKTNATATVDRPTKKAVGPAKVSAAKKQTAKAGSGKNAVAKKKIVKTRTGAAKTAAKKKVGRPKKRAGSTCRDEVVAAIKALTQDTGTDEFAAKEIVDYLIANGTSYSTGTIRSQLVSRSASEAESTDGDGPKDFMRVKRGVYRLAG